MKGERVLEKLSLKDVKKMVEDKIASVKDADYQE